MRNDDAGIVPLPSAAVRIGSGPLGVRHHRARVLVDIWPLVRVLNT